MTVHKYNRLSKEEALSLINEESFLNLAALANERSKHINGNKVAYLIDCNINYTNVCLTGCLFCAFSRPKGHSEAWELSFSDLDQQIERAINLGCQRILLQGGMHPDHDIDYHVKLIKHIHNHHDIHIHAYSPPEIDFLSKKSQLPVKTIIKRLMSVGLKSIPGGGAEILVDDVRKKISPKKCDSKTWLDVMKQAHELGLKTTATMMLGHIETWRDRIEHLDKIRTLQDKTNGFVSFIPWTFQPINTKLQNNDKIHLVTSHEYLKFIAITRLFLDNFKHIQSSTLTQGEQISQLALHFGSDDIGSIMVEEKVVASAGCDQHELIDEESLIQAIKDSGHEPYKRNTYYES